jgi:hypothetical protein
MSVEVSSAIEATADDAVTGAGTDLAVLLWVCLVALLGLAAVLTVAG